MRKKIKLSLSFTHAESDLLPTFSSKRIYKKPFHDALWEHVQKYLEKQITGPVNIPVKTKTQKVNLWLDLENEVQSKIYGLWLSHGFDETIREIIHRAIVRFAKQVMAGNSAYPEVPVPASSVATPTKPAKPKTPAPASPRPVAKPASPQSPPPKVEAPKAVKPNVSTLDFSHHIPGHLEKRQADLEVWLEENMIGGDAYKDIKMMTRELEGYLAHNLRIQDFSQNWFVSGEEGFLEPYLPMNDYLGKLFASAVELRDRARAAARGSAKASSAKAGNAATLTGRLMDGLNAVKGQ